MAIAYFVNAAEQTVTQVEYETLDDMRKFIGGYICIAHADHSTGDVLYVDDEGMLKNNLPVFAYIERLDQLLFGNGLYVGREIETEDGGWTTLPPSKTLKQFHNEIAFPIELE